MPCSMTCLLHFPRQGLVNLGVTGPDYREPALS